MKKFLGVFVVLISFSMIAEDLDARRFSGGRSIGKQREMTTPRTPHQQQQQAAPAKQQQQQATQTTSPPPQQASGASRWLGPLAGLAIGAGLAALFLNNGLAGVLAGLLLLAALIGGAMLLFRALRGQRAVARPLQYAGAGAHGGPAPAPVTPAPVAPAYGGAPAPHSVAATTQTQTAATQFAGLDAEQFVRHARMNFVNLQKAYDSGDFSAIRDFVTPELYAEIEADGRAAGDAPKTDIVTLEAEVLDVATEDDLYVVSVRFSGLTREGTGAEPQPFNEIWHLQKPTNGRSGWLVCGIQQA